MKINSENINQFMNDFEYRLFPTIKGSDGLGIERLRTIVEKKKIEVEERKIQRYLNKFFTQITDIPPGEMCNKREQDIEVYKKIEVREDLHKVNLNFDFNNCTNEIYSEVYVNNKESTQMISKSGVDANYLEYTNNINIA